MNGSKNLMTKNLMKNLTTVLGDMGTLPHNAPLAACGTFIIAFIEGQHVRVSDPIRHVERYLRKCAKKRVFKVFELA